MPEQVDVVTMHVWRVAPRRLPGVLRGLARDRGRVRALAGVRFAKLLGTSRGFAVRDADPTRWALLVSWTGDAAARAGDRSPVVRAWHDRAEESWRVLLRPLAGRGSWSRREPFEPFGVGAWHGPVAAITRARLVPRRAVAFWRAVPEVVTDLWQRPGLRAAFGIGDAPLGVQGTFSLWQDAAALRAFAYTGAAHRDAICQTQQRRWYAEEYFARLGVVASSGSLDGRDPLADLR